MVAQVQTYRVVAYGRKIGIFTNMEEMEASTYKYKGYRVFNTTDFYEAQAYLERYRGVPQDSKPIDKAMLRERANELRRLDEEKERERKARQEQESRMRSIAVEPVPEAEDQKKLPARVEATADEIKDMDFAQLSKTLAKIEDEEPVEPSETKVPEPRMAGIEYSPFDVVIYTDGSYIPVYGSGGYAAIIMFSGGSDSVKVSISGGRKHGESSFFMELMALRKALKKLSHYKVAGKVYFFTDSKVLIDSLYHNPAASTEYQDRQQEILNELYKYHYAIYWVKSHSGDMYNEECDKMAKLEARLAALN